MHRSLWGTAPRQVQRNQDCACTESDTPAACKLMKVFGTASTIAWHACCVDGLRESYWLSPALAPVPPVDQAQQLGPPYMHRRLDKSDEGGRWEVGARTCRLARRR